MASQFLGLEKKLDEVFRTKAPWQLPEGAKKWLVKWLPIINLVLGVLTLWAALGLWRWAHQAETLVNWANELARTYGGTEVSASRLTVWLWISLIFMIIQGALYVAAYPGTKAKKKSGWNLLFYAALLNLLSGVVVLFTNYGGVSSFVGTLIGTAIGLYFLFQIRPYYLGKKAVDTPTKQKAKD